MKIIFIIIIFHLAKGCVDECTIKSGYTPNQCSFYEDNNDWLPPNYVFATTCVCSDDRLNYPSINCVRKELQELHDSRFTEVFKDEARELLSEFLHGRMSSEDYRSWSSMAFAREVYDIHKEAFARCCCTKTPAPLYFWHAIFDWQFRLPCFSVRIGQHEFSDCGCQY